LVLSTGNNARHSPNPQRRNPLNFQERSFETENIEVEEVEDVKTVGATSDG
jgi:hypothetical protein